MTGDEMKRVRPGDAFRIPAATYNRALDAIRANERRTVFGPTPMPRQAMPASIVYATNVSGEVAPMHGMCRWWCNAQGTLHWFSYVAGVTYNGVTSYDGRFFGLHQAFGILLECAAPGECARVVVAGGRYPVKALNGPYHTGAPTSLVGCATHWYATPALVPGTAYRRDSHFCYLLPTSMWDEMTGLIDAIIVYDDPVSLDSGVAGSVDIADVTEWGRWDLCRLLVRHVYDVGPPVVYLHEGFDEKGHLYFCIKSEAAEVPLKWRCTGAPEYECVQDDPLGYATEELCLAACEAPVVLYSCTGFPWYQCYEDPEGEFESPEACAAGCEFPAAGTIYDDDGTLWISTGDDWVPVDPAKWYCVVDQGCLLGSTLTEVMVARTPYAGHVSESECIIYCPPWNLWVQSWGAAGVTITSSTGHGGVTDYSKTDLADQAAVNLVAPATEPDDYVWVRWRVNGTPTGGGSKTLDFNIGLDCTCVAEYQVTQCPSDCSGCNDAYHFHENGGGWAERIGDPESCRWSGDFLMDLVCAGTPPHWTCMAYFGPEIGTGQYRKDASACPAGVYTRVDPEFGGTPTIELHAG